MASKFTESTLGVKYRNEYPDGTVSGGPMYYLSKGFAERGMAGAGRIGANIGRFPHPSRQDLILASPGGDLADVMGLRVEACHGRRCREVPGSSPGMTVRGRKLSSFRHAKTSG